MAQRHRLTQALRLTQGRRLTQAKKRHRVRSGRSSAGWPWFLLSLVVVVIAATAFCAVRLGLSPSPRHETADEQMEVDTQSAGSGQEGIAGKLGRIVRGIMGSASVSVPPESIVASLLPAGQPTSAGRDEDPEQGPTCAEPSGESAVTAGAILSSVGDILTSSVFGTPVDILSTQLSTGNVPTVIADKPGTLLKRASLEALRPALSVSDWDIAVPVAGVRDLSPQPRPDTGPGTTSEPQVTPSVRLVPEAGASRSTAPTVNGDTVVYGSDPVVAIYSTHSSETYVASEGADHIWGTTEGMLRVGEELARTLWINYGISTVRSTRVHDVPYNTSYVRSAETASELVKDHPGLKLVLDLHRDAVAGSGSPARTIMLDGKEVAKVLIIVTTDKYGLPHPNWRLNAAMAERLRQAMDDLYPGLCRGVRVENEGRYNQHLHPGSLLLEIGDVSGARQAAINATSYIADAIQRVLARSDDGLR